MTGPHSPWPLFGDDLELARAWLHPQLRGVVSLRTGHLAISLGMGDALLGDVQSGAVQTDANALRQWRFRWPGCVADQSPRHLPRVDFSSTPRPRSPAKQWEFPLVSAEWRHR